MKVLVTGAGGFVGQRVVAGLLDQPGVTVRALDRVLPDSAAERMTGDLADRKVQAAAMQDVDAVIHLAAILGGAAEADPATARRVNLDATLDLMAAAHGKRFVFASTIAAYGPLMPDPVTDDTPLAPTLLYGAHKVMIETALSQHSARGWIDGVALRVSGVMARDGADAALKTAFMSRLFHAVAQGKDITLPIAEDSRTWMASVGNVAQNFIHALTLPDFGARRAFTLPALCVTFGDLAAALSRRFPDSGAQVRFEPDPETVAMFGRFPGLVTETADGLGFARDTDADALVARAFD